MRATITLCFLFCSVAANAQTASHCMAVEFAKAAIEAHGSQWVETTPDQLQFLRGIYAMNPQTPAGMPYGDKAVLAKAPDASRGGVVFFIDGDRACTPMPVPKELVDMLTDVATGVISHEKGGT